MRRAQISELTRSESFQSGPRSITTTFLPLRASTAANAAPEAPAPTMTASTFSSVAISPAPFRRDVGHIGHAQAGKPFHRSVGDVDCVVAQRQINIRLPGTLPSLQLVLPKRVYEIVVLPFIQVCIGAPVQRLARAFNAGKRGTIEIDVGRTRFTDPNRQQRLFRRYRKLMVNEMSDALNASANRQRFADGLQGLCLFRSQHAKRYTLGSCLLWCQQ